MADTDEKKAKKQDKAPRPESSEQRQGRRPPKVAKADKAATDGKAAKAREAGDAARARTEVPARLKAEFDQTIRGRLAEQFGYKNRMQIPSSTRSSSTWASARALPTARRSKRPLNDLALISGQKPMITKARKSIATYKLRDGQASAAR